MVMSDRVFPIELPPHVQQEGGWWIGANDIFAPQCYVEGGPDLTELLASYQEKGRIVLRLFSWTLDAIDDQADDRGLIEVELKEIEDREVDSTFNILGNAVIPFNGRKLSTVWVHGYDPASGTGTLDVRAV